MSGRVGEDRAGLRVLTWNVRDLLGDPLAVHRVLRAARPDVACLQEAHRWPGSRARLATLARRSGLLYLCGGRESAGTALLMDLRTEVAATTAARLPVTGRLTRPRGYAAATVGLPGTSAVRVVSLHLGLDASERADHCDRLLASLPDGAPVVLAGDLNEPPGGPSWTAFAERALDPPHASPAATFPARSPRRRIDAVLVDPALTVTSHGWPDGVAEADVVLASDHRPVLATITLPSR